MSPKIHAEVPDIASTEATQDAAATAIPSSWHSRSLPGIIMVPEKCPVRPKSTTPAGQEPKKALRELLQGTPACWTREVSLIQFSRHPASFEKVLKENGAVVLEQCKSGPRCNGAKMLLSQKDQAKVHKSIRKRKVRTLARGGSSPTSGRLELHHNSVVIYDSCIKALMDQITNECKKNACKTIKVVDRIPLGIFHPGDGKENDPDDVRFTPVCNGIYAQEANQDRSFDTSNSAPCCPSTYDSSGAVSNSLQKKNALESPTFRSWMQDMRAWFNAKFNDGWEDGDPNADFYIPGPLYEA